MKRLNQNSILILLLALAGTPAFAEYQQQQQGYDQQQYQQQQQQQQQGYDQQQQQQYQQQQQQQGYDQQQQQQYQQQPQQSVKQQYKAAANQYTQDPAYFELMAQYLRQRLTLPTGQLAKISVMTPFAQTGAKLGRKINSVIVDKFSTYGINNVEANKAMVRTLTRDDFQKAAEESKSDVVVLVLILNGKLELFLFDAREPTRIYTSSQAIPFAESPDYVNQVAYYYTEYVTNHVLSLYINGYYYNLPEKRNATQDILNIAQDLYEGEAQKKKIWYFSPSLGFLKGSSKDGSDSFLTYYFSLDFGRQIYEEYDLWAELGIEHWGYTVLSLGVKYYYLYDEASNFKISLGLAGGMAGDKHPWESQPTTAQFLSEPTKELAGFYIIPSLGANFMFKGLEAKVELKAFVGPAIQFGLLTGVMTRF